MHFFPQKKLTIFCFSCHPQNTGRQCRFTVKIKQIKQSDTVTFLFSVHSITKAKQYTGLSRAEPGRWIFQPGHLTWHVDLACPGVAPPLHTTARKSQPTGPEMFEMWVWRRTTDTFDIRHNRYTNMCAQHLTGARMSRLHNVKLLIHKKQNQNQRSRQAKKLVRQSGGKLEHEMKEEELERKKSWEHSVTNFRWAESLLVFAQRFR